MAIHSHCSPTMFITRNTPPFHSQKYADKASFINTHFTTTRTHLQSSSRGNGCPAASNILPQQTHATIREFTSMYSINTTFRRLYSLDAELSRVYSALVDSQHQHQDEALLGKSGTPHCWPIHNIKATTIVEQNSLSSVVRFGQSSQLVTECRGRRCCEHFLLKDSIKGKSPNLPLL